MNHEDTPLDWQVPTFQADPQRRYAWVEESIQEGEGWLSGQAAYKNLGRNMRIFEAIFEDGVKSGYVSNGLKYNIRKFVETLSDVREIATYGSDAIQFKPFAEILNKVAQSLYLEADYSRQLRKAIQYAAVAGRGYLSPFCLAGDYGWGERKIIFEPSGLMDVVPVQVPDTNDIQEAYAVTKFRYMPVAEAHGRFPLFQSSLQPVDSAGYSSRMSSQRVDYAEKFRYGQSEQRRWGAMNCEIRYTWVRDLAVNRYDMELPMGDPGTSWSYTVPYIGQQIRAGVRNGQVFYRQAQAEDCRIYPFLRLIITAKGMDRPMYDGPAFDWHGRIPIVQIDVDDWPWQGVGGSLVQDVGSIEMTKRRLERKMERVINTTLNPPMGYDRSSAGGSRIENFDIFEENLRVGVDGQPAAVLQSMLPETVQVNAMHFQFLERLEAQQKEQLGIDDIGSLTDLKANITSGDVDRLLSSIGPIAKGIAANIESASAKIGYMVMWMIPQWYDVKRVIQYVGPDKITPQVFDFDPHSLIPAHLLDELEHRPGDGNHDYPDAPSVYDQITRARAFCANLRLTSIPSTLLKVTQMQEQLKYLQLYRGGFPISAATVAQKLDIPNYGDVPGATEHEKWVNEKMESLQLQAQAQQMAMQLGIGGAPPDAGGQPGPPHAGGRPPSGQAPPQIKQKGANSGNPRTVISESN